MKASFFSLNTSRPFTAILLIAILAFPSLFLMQTASASAPQPTFKTAVVNGFIDEWWPSDFFAYLYPEGNSTQPRKAQLQLIYELSTETLFVAVTTLNSPIVTSPSDAWGAIDNSSNQVYDGNADGGTQPNFAWISQGYDRNASHAQGYEASFHLAPGTYTLLVNVEVYDDGENKTLATEGSPQTGISLVINVNPRILLTKIISTDNRTWQSATTPPGISVTAGSSVFFGFNVQNLGNVPLSNVTVTDSDLGLNTTLTSPLQPGKNLVLYLGPVTAEIGQHTNNASATGQYNNTYYNSTATACYFGNPLPSNPAIKVVKYISTDNATWDDANTPPGLQVDTGTQVYFKYNMTNIGDVELFNLSLTDNIYSLDADPPNSLSPNASFTYYFGPTTAQNGQHTNTATATADYNNTSYSDTDNANYYGTIQPKPAIGLLKQISTDNRTWITYPSIANLTTGSWVYYKYTITNDGDVALSNITLSDNAHDIGFFEPSLVIAPDTYYTFYWGTSATRSGLNNNTATVSGRYGDTTYTNTSIAAYYGSTALNGQICIEKYVSTNRYNWYSADNPPGITILADKYIYYKLVTRNTGNVTLSDITLEDRYLDTESVTIPSTLQPGEYFSVIFGPFKAQLLQQTNQATATGTYQNTIYTATDTVNYYGTLRTYTAYEYRGTGTAGKLLTYNFKTTFSNGLEIGCYTNADGFGYKWTSPSSLKSFLGYTGTSNPIIYDKLNPYNLRSGGGTLAVQTAVLSLNIHFGGISSNMPDGLGDLVYVKSGDSLNEKTVSEILAAANDALGGHALPQGYTYSSLKSLVEHLNTAFDAGTPNSWAKAYLRVATVG